MGRVRLHTDRLADVEKPPDEKPPLPGFDKVCEQGVDGIGLILGTLLCAGEALTFIHNTIRWWGQEPYYEPIRA